MNDVEKAIASLTSLSQQQKLELLHDSVVCNLIKLILNEEATGAEMSAAISLLKNNNITVAPEVNDEMDELRKHLENSKRAKKTFKPSQDNILHLNVGGGSGE